MSEGDFLKLSYTQIYIHIQINIWFFHQLWATDINRIKKSPNRYSFLVQQSSKTEYVVGPIYHCSTSSGTKEKSLLCGEFLPIKYHFPRDKNYFTIGPTKYDSISWLGNHRSIWNLPNGWFDCLLQPGGCWVEVGGWKAYVSLYF